jgi:glycosyltransferase involved in cell wall biosynthesis
MQLCEEVADGLSAKGHAIAILTSTCCDGNEIARSYPVHRLLPIDPDWHSGKLGFWQFCIGRRRRERQGTAHLRRLVQEFAPDIIFIWHFLGLPRVLLREAEQLPDVTVAYYLADYLPERPDEYIAYWRLPPVHPAAKLLKPLLTRLAVYLLAREGKPTPLKYENSVCVSDYLRRRLVSQGLIPEDAVVIHNGVNLSCFSPDARDSRTCPSSRLRCLVAGRVVPEKGVHTVIEALACLQATAELDGIRLTVLGDGPADYVAHLNGRMHRHHLQDTVEFRSPVPREQMPKLLAGHDVLILPSEYHEPLARAMQEALAMGLLVIGTTTGGSSELLVHEKTGLVFAPGDPESLAAQLSRASNEPNLVTRLARAGQQAVKREFDIRRTIGQIEDYLLDLVLDKSA